MLFCQYIYSVHPALLRRHMESQLSYKYFPHHTQSRSSHRLPCYMILIYQPEPLPEPQNISSLPFLPIEGFLHMFYLVPGAFYNNNL